MPALAKAARALSRNALILALAIQSAICSNGWLPESVGGADACGILTWTAAARPEGIAASLDEKGATMNEDIVFGPDDGYSDLTAVGAEMPTSGWEGYSPDVLDKLEE